MPFTLGSMADCPPDLLESIKELERLFTVDQAKLKEITNHFVKELAKGSFTMCRISQERSKADQVNSRA